MEVSRGRVPRIAQIGTILGRELAPMQYGQGIQAYNDEADPGLMRLESDLFSVRKLIRPKQVPVTELQL